MDADRLYSLVKALDGDKEKPIQFMLNSGANGSALEHSVPEQMFSIADNPVEGISAVKALKIANDQGVPVYSIDQTNIGTILPQLQIDGGTISDIQNAVNAGKIVTVSKTDITYNGWTGCGYIIIDPTTGEGAYMISGGLSGGVILTFLGALLMVVGLFLLSNPITAAFGIYLMTKGAAFMILGVGLLTDLFSNELWECIKSVEFAIFELYRLVMGLVMNDPSTIVKVFSIITVVTMAMKPVFTDCKEAADAM